MKKRDWFYSITLFLLIFISSFTIYVVFSEKNDFNISGGDLFSLLGIIVSSFSILITGYFVILAIDAYSKIREIDKAKEKAEILSSEIKGAKKIKENTKKEFEIINKEFEKKEKDINNISNELCELLKFFTEEAVFHAEKTMNGDFRNDTLKNLYRFAYKYPKVIKDERMRESYLLNLSTYGDYSDIEHLKKLYNSKKESKTIKNIAHKVMEKLQERFPES